MQLDRFGGWVGLIANLGLIVGLVLVALELRHSTQIAEAQAVSTFLAGQMAGETALMGDDAAAALVKAIEEPAAMSSAEVMQVWTYLFTALTSIQGSFEMYELGLASPEDWTSARKQANSYLGFPFARAWWREVGPTLPPAFAAEIDLSLEGVDPDLVGKQLARMKAAAVELGG